jgi:hypothetical protein
MFYISGVIINFLMLKYLNNKFKNDKCLKKLIFNDAMAIILVMMSWIGFISYFLTCAIILYVHSSTDCKDSDKTIFKVFREIDEFSHKIF